MDIELKEKEFVEIYNFIKNTYNFGLKKYIESGGNLCELSINFFDNENRPDYNKLHVQQSYLLKYCLAYSFEYYKMYKKILSFIKDKSELNVLSVGCGSCLDYWSLCYLLYNVGLDIKINYVGVDPIKWYANDIENSFNKEVDNDKFNRRNKDNCYFIQSTVDNFYQKIGDDISYLIKNLDIVIFPRSIEEIYNDKNSNEIVKNIITNIDNDIFVLMASTYNKKQYDMLEQFSYIDTNCKKYVEKMLTFNKVGISSINSYFQYPDDIKKDYISLCSHKNNGKCDIHSDKFCYINESPIFYADKVKYSYFIIEKK